MYRNMGEAAAVKRAEDPTKVVKYTSLFDQIDEIAYGRVFHEEHANHRHQLRRSRRTAGG